MHHHDELDLDVFSSDGGDGVAIGMLLPAVQKVREAAARMELDLGGGGNLVDVISENVDDVGLSIKTSSPASAGIPNQITVALTRLANPRLPEEIAVSGLGLVSLNLDTAGQEGDIITITGPGFGAVSVDLNTAGGNDLVSLDFANNDDNPSPSSVDAVIDLGEGNDKLSFITDATTSVNLDVRAGAGDDEIRIGDGEPIGRRNTEMVRITSLIVDLGTGADYLRVALNNHRNVSLDVLSADGRDRVESPILINVCQPPSGGPSFPCGLHASLQLGGGDNDVEVRTENFDKVDLDVAALGGGNVVEINQGWGKWEIHPARIAPQNPTSRANLILTGDGNKVGFDTRGYDEVDLDLDLTGNSNEVAIGLLLPAVQKVREAAARVSLDLGGGGNLVDVQTDNVDQVDLDASLSGGDNQVAIGLLLPAVQKGSIRAVDETARMSLQLGGGGNLVDLSTEGFGEVDLDLDLTGNSNEVAIGLLLPAVQRVREEAARMKMDLDGGGNFVDVRMENIPNVDLSIVSEPASPEEVTGGTINVYWHVIRNGSANAGRDETVEILTSSLPGGTAVPPTVGVSPTSFSFPATAGGADAASTVNAALNLGPADDTVSITTDGVSNVNLAVDTGDGNDTVEVRSNVFAVYVTTGFSNVTLGLMAGPGDDEVRIHNWGFSEVTTIVDSGEGDDTVELDTQWTNSVGRYRTLRPRPIDQIVNLGPGDDRLTANSEGYAQVTTFIDAGDGNDTVAVTDQSDYVLWRQNFGSSPSRLEHDVNLGAGDDRLEIDAADYADVNSFIDAGAGNDGVSYGPHRDLYLNIWINQVATLNFVALLGAGSDSLVLETLGYREIRTAINTGPAGDGRDRVSASHQSLRRSGRVHLSRLVLGGGMDVYERRAVGYTVQTTVTTTVVIEYLFLAT